MLNTIPITPGKLYGCLETLYKLRLPAYLAGPPGIGKCLGRGTPVLMHNGTVKPVECIQEGDLVMGADSLPRKVLATTSGVGMLYKIVPAKGEAYVVNSRHVLSLKMNARGKGYREGDIVNIPVLDYLKKNADFIHHSKGWRTGVEFAACKTVVDPYFLGLWLGDGKSTGLIVTTADQEIVEYLDSFAAEHGLTLRADTKANATAASYRLTTGTKPGQKRGGRNPLLNYFREYNLLGNKHIPYDFAVNSREARLQLLAGILDADGHLINGCFEVSTVSPVLAEAYLYLARSLGFAAYQKVCVKTIKSLCYAGDYFRIHISGELSEIPTKIPRKQAKKRRQVKNVCVTGIKVYPIGEGEYFGFELNGDQLFLLGDFTVTHNSAVVRQFARAQGLELVTLMLSQVEPSDVRGLPFLDRDAGRTRWLIPEFYPPQDSDSRGILFLDELANAEPRVQVAAYQLLLDRKVGEYTLPPGWVCVAAGNRLEDSANVYELSSALADRLVFFNVTCEPRDWLHWAREHDIAPEVLAFIQVKPDFLEGNQMQQQADQIIVPTPRSWERVSQILKAERDPEIRQYLLGGVIGQAASVEFIHVVEEIKDLPPIEELFKVSPAEARRRLFPRSIAGLYGLTYSVTAYVNDLDGFRKAVALFNELDEIEGKLPGAEIQTLAVEILMDKATQRGLWRQLTFSPEYGAYRKKGQMLTNIDLPKPAQ